MTTKRARQEIKRILITGTPGTGKTTLCQEIEKHFPKVFVLNVADLVKQDKSLQHSYDDVLKAYVMRESRVRRRVKSLTREHFEDVCLVECHAPGIFKRSMFDLAVVLTTDTAPLYDRLTKRGYNDEKMEENITAEIMNIGWEEAMDVFGHDSVIMLPNNTNEDVTINVQRVLQRIQGIN